MAGPTVFDLIVQGGTLVTSGSTCRADVGILAGRIETVGNLADASAKRVLNAKDCLVLPGLIDPHTHMTGVNKSFPSLGDGLRAISRAALWGGTTTILQFIPSESTTLEKDVSQVIEEHTGLMATDFGIHVSLRDPLTEEGLLTSAAEMGVTSFHFSLSGGRGRQLANDATLMRGMELAAAQRAMVVVHAENKALNEDAIARLQAQGELTIEQVGDCHPWYSEGEAARRAVFLASVVGASLYVEHLSTEPALDAVRAARKEGHNVFAETCPHYLSFNKEMYKTPRALEFCKSPPLRRSEDQEALWKGMVDGAIHSIGTDESTAQLANKQRLLKERPIYEVSGGLNEIEIRLPVIYTELVIRRKESPTRVVQLLSSNPARLFGLYPQKGSLSPGADADLVIIDPSIERKITNGSLHQQTDHTIYEGWITRGWPKSVIFGGDVVMNDGELVGNPTGRYLKRGPAITKWHEEVLNIA